MRLWENTSATLHAESDTDNFKESESEPWNIAGPKIARKLLKLNGCLTKRTSCLAGLSNEKISHNSIIGNAKKSNWQWISAYTAAMTFSFFFPSATLCVPVCTQVQFTWDNFLLTLPSRCAIFWRTVINSPGTELWSNQLRRTHQEFG